MTASTLGNSKDAPHVCPCCALPFVQPVRCEYAGNDRWGVSLRCPSCGWGGNRTLNATLLERLEDQLEEGMRQVEALLLRMTQRNMRDYAERFTAALAEDGVLPEDF